MPILGLAFPSAAATTPAALTPPDPMHGSFMMLNLGVGAPIAALVAWLLFGTVIGAAAGSRTTYPSVRQLRASWTGRTNDPGTTQTPDTTRTLVLRATIAIVVLLAIGVGVARLNTSPADSPVTTTRTLATEPAQALPSGADYFSILELTQAPGGALGPHAHPYSGFAYSLKGVATIAFSTGSTIEVGPGDVGFIGTQAGHSHQNAEDRVPSAALALLIVALAVVVCLIWLRPARRDGRLLPIALVLLIGVGAIGTLNPWSNDWLFLSVRGVAQRGGPMPLPTSSRIYESSDLVALPPGRYVQTLEEITVPPGAEAADAGSASAALLFVLDGQVQVQPVGGSPTQIGARGATLLSSGAAVRVTNAGDHPAHLLKLGVVAAGS
jgi:quercetin dioxygenase-like cupin family protein